MKRKCNISMISSVTQLGVMKMKPYTVNKVVGTSHQIEHEPLVTIATPIVV